MKIQIKELELHSFCNIKDRTIKFYDNTIVKGVNKIGKTTILNAINWVLFNKLVDGTNADDKVRKHDENGVNENYVDVSATITADFDGKEVKAKKTQKQVWVKDRTTQSQTFKGNSNEYEINGIPKKDKEFTEYISNFVDPQTFLYCINPRIFFNLDTKKRREMLFGLVGEFSDDMVIASNPEYEPLKSELMDGTIEQLISRSAKIKKLLEENLNAIPIRIDELSHQIIEVDEDRLNNEKATLVNLLEAEQERIADIEEATKDYSDIVKRISELEREQEAIKGKVESEYKNQIKELDDKIFEFKSKLDHQKRKLAVDETLIKDYEASKEVSDREITNLHKEWVEENAKAFDESELICPVCGSEYTEEKATKIKKEFETNKIARLKKIEENANSYKQRVEAREKEIELALERVAETQKAIVEAEESIKAYEEKKNKINAPDATKKKEYKALTAEIEKLTKAKQNVTNGSDEKTKILNSMNEINSRINAIDIQLSKVGDNANVQARIESLDKERKETCQKIANEEKKIDLLKAYQRTKVTMLTEKINSYFDVIKWQMFKEQINGDYADVCIPLVEGTSYDGLLNHGNKILAEIDLCRAFQRANDIVCPILIDDSESLDEWRIPKIDSQLIILRRTDDEELLVERI